MNNGNGNGHGSPSENGNGNGKHHQSNGNGHKYVPSANGNGNGHDDVLLMEDRFIYLESIKPRLFSSKQEVIAKTGIRKNILFFLFFLTLGAYLTSLPLSTTVVDRRATVVPLQKIEFTSPKDGFLTQVFFKEGEAVKKGDLLYRVESSEDQARLQESEFEIGALEKELAAVGFEAKMISLKLEDAKELKKLGSGRERAVEEVSLLLQAKQARIESLLIKLGQGKVRQAFLKENLSEGEVRAPLDGRVISNSQLKEHAFVKEGEFLMTLAGEGSIMEFGLKEGDYSRISLGSKAKIKFYAFPEETYLGRVIGLRPFAEPYPKSSVNKHVIKVLIEWEKAPKQIQNGMTAKVTIEAKSKSILGRFYHELF